MTLMPSQAIGIVTLLMRCALCDRFPISFSADFFFFFFFLARSSADVSIQARIVWENESIVELRESGWKSDFDEGTLHSGPILPF
jgi:hypothetical protein